MTDVQTFPIELMKVALERSEAINTYWNFYLAVAGAIIGILSSDKVTITRTLRGAIGLVFTAWAASNLQAIWILNRERQTLCDLLVLHGGEFTRLATDLSPQEPWKYLVFHLVLDAGVLAFIALAKQVKP
jgi:hypothetical protein